MYSLLNPNVNHSCAVSVVALQDSVQIVRSSRKSNFESLLD